MKIRRIDDLGRITIPTEYREAAHIDYGDPVEISLNSECQICLQKYCPDLSKKFKLLLDEISYDLSYMDENTDNNKYYKNLINDFIFDLNNLIK